MEQNKEMTAQQSLVLISETLKNNRQSILKNNAKYFMLWGILLTVMSLAIYLLWHHTGNPVWNLLWFTMPALGYPLAELLNKKDAAIPQNLIGKLIRTTWMVFGIFAITISAFSVFVVPMPNTLVIVIILGLAESMSGVLLKNWPIIIGGFIVGVGGAVAASFLKTEAQLLLFTLCGIVLTATGLIVKYQNK